MRGRRPCPGRGARALAVLVLALVATACGGGGDAPEPEGASTPLTLTLDFAPNAVHTGLLLAEERRLFDRARAPVRLRPPSATTDGVRLLRAGRTDLAVLSLHDLALAREAGADLVAVGALVQVPLGAVLAGPAVRRPADLQGRRVGLTGVPSDEAVLDELVRADGGDPRRVRRLTVGFEGVQAVLTGRLDATIGFWNAEGVALRVRRPRARVLRLADSGAPRYPELVVVAERATLRARAGAVARALGAMREGYAATLRDPAAGLRALRRRAPAAVTATTAAELRAVLPAFAGPGGRPLGVDRGVLARWAAWEARVGIVRRPPDVRRLLWDRAPR